MTNQSLPHTRRKRASKAADGAQPPPTNGHRRETALAYGGMICLVVVALLLTLLAYRQYEANRSVEPWIAAAVTLIVRELSGIVRWYEQRY